MKLVVISRKKALLLLLAFFTVMVLSIFVRSYFHHSSSVKMVMGGRYYNQTSEADKKEINAYKEDVETYFRPSDLPVLNNRTTRRFFDEYFGRSVTEIALPAYLFKTPEDTLINYFSILREAANPKGIRTGCGTIGNATLPYPVAYQFLTSSYQKELPYEQYLGTFENILHINLIKYREVPVYNNTSDITRYFIELETIEGSKKDIGYFAYYYGFVDFMNENGQYKISNLEFTGENYLCAPYHGWSYDAEGSVQVRYGGWCKLIKEMYPVKRDGYVKEVYFKGTDGYDYRIEFYQLTNDTDIEIAQYRKKAGSDWELIKLDPNECIKGKH